MVARSGGRGGWETGFSGYRVDAILEERGVLGNCCTAMPLVDNIIRILGNSWVGKFCVMCFIATIFFKKEYIALSINTTSSPHMVKLSAFYVKLILYYFMFKLLKCLND